MLLIGISPLIMTAFSLIYSDTLALSASYTTPKWNPIDIEFTFNKKLESSFDTEFGCIFSGPDGQSLKVPGFFNGNNEWIVRFCPNENGIWEYISYSTESGLTGKKGTVNVTESLEDAHGPVKVNPEDPRHLMYEDGKPYFLMAFEADWLFALDYGQESLIKSERLIKTIKENGFNQVVMNVYAHDVSWKKMKSSPT